MSVLQFYPLTGHAHGAVLSRTLTRLMTTVLVLAGLCGHATAQTTDASAAAGAAGRWEISTEGIQPNSEVTLALVNPQGQRTWQHTWLHTYEPTLRLLPQWRYNEGAVLAVTVQHGAAAAELTLFGLGRGEPTQLHNELVSAVEWKHAPDGEWLLVVDNPSDNPPPLLVSSCYGWNEVKAQLAPKDCPPE
jgi:hypothetical protein